MPMNAGLCTMAVYGCCGGGFKQATPSDKPVAVAGIPPSAKVLSIHLSCWTWLYNSCYTTCVFTSPFKSLRVLLAHRSNAQWNVPFDGSLIYTSYAYVNGWSYIEMPAAYQALNC